MSVDPIFEKYLPEHYQHQFEWEPKEELEGNGGIYNSTNLGVYTYSFNNPVLYYDPDGNSGALFFVRPTPIINPRATPQQVAPRPQQLPPAPRGGESKAQYMERFNKWNAERKAGWKEEVHTPTHRTAPTGRKGEIVGQGVRFVDKVKNFLQDLFESIGGGDGLGAVSGSVPSPTTGTGTTENTGAESAPNINEGADFSEACYESGMCV